MTKCGSAVRCSIPQNGSSAKKNAGVSFCCSHSRLVSVQRAQSGRKDAAEETCALFAVLALFAVCVVCAVWNE